MRYRSLLFGPSTVGVVMNDGNRLSEHYRTHLARRWFLRDCSVGLGAVALQQLLGGAVCQAGTGTGSAVNPLAPRMPHHEPKAKRVIFLFMAGAPSHLDLFDYKPELA